MFAVLQLCASGEKVAAGQLGTKSLKSLGIMALSQLAFSSGTRNSLKQFAFLRGAAGINFNLLQTQYISIGFTPKCAR